MYSSVLKQTFQKSKINNIIGISQYARRLYATGSSDIDPDEYTKEPEYPEILDLSYEARKQRGRAAWHEEVKKVTTVEGKLIKVNMPKYYGYKCHMLNKGQAYNCLPSYRHWTRTVFKGDIPVDYYGTNAEEEDKLCGEIRDLIEEAVVFHQKGYRNGLNQIDDAAERERQLSLKICSDINRVLLLALRPTKSHLDQTELDIEPRHEAFWFVGGINPLLAVQRARKKLPFLRDTAMKPHDRAFQYQGVPLLSLRNRIPLQPIHDIEHAEVAAAADVPRVAQDPRTIGYMTIYRHGVTIPGFWPSSQHQFGQLSWHDRTHMINRNPAYGAEDHQEALHAQGILNSYAWLYGQACYQGFSTFNDITYPLVTQTIITNGQLWSFYLYQLNTTIINSHVFDTNSKANECWGTKELKLYESIDENGKLVGFNDDVVRHLIRFYGNVPQERDIEMRPYLGEEEQTVADIEDVKRREFLERQYKHIMANKPRHRLLPEVYHWEKIYKIDNETMPIEPRRRFFELEKNPWARRLDEHAPKYIPKALRPNGPKSKPKFEETYWP